MRITMSAPKLVAVLNRMTLNMCIVCWLVEKLD